MSKVLVDSSVWIDYFRGSPEINKFKLEELIDNNQVCTNDLILSELLPPLILQKQEEVIDILKTIKNIPISIVWNDIIDYQIINLKNGINKVGVPDLILLQNTIQNNLIIFSSDKHFELMSKYIEFKTFGNL